MPPLYFLVLYVYLLGVVITTLIFAICIVHMWRRRHIEEYRKVLALFISAAPEYILLWPHRLVYTPIRSWKETRQEK